MESLGAGSADQLKARFSGTFDLDDPLRRDSVIVTVVVGTVTAITEKTDQKTGDDVHVHVVKVDQFAVVNDAALRDHLYSLLALEGEVQLTIPFDQPVTALPVAAVQPEIDVHSGESYVDPDEGEVFSPGAVRPAAVKPKDPVLASFLWSGGPG